MKIEKLKSKKIKQRYNLGIAILLISMLSIPNALAFAVSTAYWEGSPLKIMAGETKDIQVVLQNMAGGENITVKAKISEGEDIAKISDASDIYEIPLGTKKEVNIQIKVPENYKIGGKDSIKLSFTTITTGTGGGFGFGSSIDKTIPILIVNKKGEAKEPTNLWLVVLIIGILIVVIGIIIIFIRRNKINKTAIKIKK